jgi:signal transduction histidine kinase/ActR/RegA family two-component response regulator
MPRFDPRGVTSRWSPHTLFGKLLLVFATLVVVPFALYSGVNVWFAYDEQRAALGQVQRGSAQIAAQRITQFVKEIETQLAWTTLVPLRAGALEARRLDALRVLRQSPAIVDLALVDEQGKERVSVSRVSLDRLDTGIDRSMERAFASAQREQAYYGPVTFRRETEPFMTLAVAGSRREFGVAIAEVNLKLIRDVVSRIEVGRDGKAWVVDRTGRLVAHPDISLVLSNMDLSQRVRDIVERADAAGARGRVADSIEGLQGGRVLASYAQVAPMGWTVVVELPQAEADEPLWRALQRALWIALASLVVSAVLAVLLAKRVVRPIRVLAAGAQRLGAGDFKHRIELGTGDELEDLGRQFNGMATEIESSYAQLEAKVEERTRELALANASKSRFLAAASHDLRQPLHALSLLVGQLEGDPGPARREQLADRIARAVSSINELFDGLLDISKLDAGVVAPALGDVPLAPILQRVHARFADDADAKGLRLLLAPTRAWVRSDPQMLERIVQNLVGNAVRYTRHGGVVVGCRWGGPSVRIEVWDSGPGIPADKQKQVFSEFYQVDRQGGLRSEGLGLGLSIVDRLCSLLGHPIGLRSEPGRGSCFAVTVPRVRARPAPDVPPPVNARIDVLRGRRVLVVDDDDLVRESAAGLLESWGCLPLLAASGAEALERLGRNAPELVISDFHLGQGELADELLARLREAFGSGFAVILMSGDVTAATRDRARALGLPLLDKPVRPMALRALASRLLADAAAPPPGTTADPASSPAR